MEGGRFVLNIKSTLCRSTDSVYSQITRCYLAHVPYFLLACGGALLLGLTKLLGKLIVEGVEVKFARVNEMLALRYTPRLHLMVLIYSHTRGPQKNHRPRM